MKKFLIVLTALLATAFFTSCDSKLLMQLNKDGNSAEISFSTSFSKPAAETLAELTGMAGEKTTDSQFITAEDVKALLRSCGFENVSATVTKDNKISAKGTIKDLKNHPLAKGGILKTAGGLTVELGAASLLNFYGMLDEESKGYLDLLMAPVFTEDNISEAEYKELLESVYGDVLAEELTESTLTVNTKTVKLGKLLTCMKSPWFSVKIADGK